MAFHERKYANLALRLTGVTLLTLAVLIGRRLFGVADPTATFRPSAYLFALIGMTSACSGAALAVLGHHLFDQVDLPARWAIHPPAPKSSAELGSRDAR